MRFILPLILALLCAHTTNGAVVEYTNKAAWDGVAGTYSTVTFAELPLFTLITSQYANLGVLFTDGSDYTHGFSMNTFPNDGYGLNGALDTTTLQFSQPMYTIAADFPGRLIYHLFWQGQLFYSSSNFGGFGSGHFAGLISDQPFDKVFIVDPNGDLFIDDIHFGPAIPAPGALALAAIASVMHRRRRR